MTARSHPFLDAIVRPHTLEERFAVETAHADALRAMRALEIYVDGDGRIVDCRLTLPFAQRIESSRIACSSPTTTS
ncbi:MAG: hypothetical protein M3N13_07865 [Candidatus Eremiobacteraeota bacterium]|nr:hypothetical protein [Candidatus Eremiobacteraeota bacterium]